MSSWRWWTRIFPFFDVLDNLLQHHHTPCPPMPTYALLAVCGAGAAIAHFFWRFFIISRWHERNTPRPACHHHLPIYVVRRYTRACVGLLPPPRPWPSCSILLYKKSPTNHAEEILSTHYSVFSPRVPPSFSSDLFYRSSAMSSKLTFYVRQNDEVGIKR